MADPNASRAFPFDSDTTVISLVLFGDTIQNGSLRNPRGAYIDPAGVPDGVNENAVRSMLRD
jgi:hypothetical protein